MASDPSRYERDSCGALRNQNQHQSCADVLQRSELPLVVTPFVLAEVDYLIQKFAGTKAELLFLEEVARGAFELASFNQEDVRRAQEIIMRYHDLAIGLTDASIVVAAEHYDCRDVLTLDLRHFRALRPSGRRSFRILPADR